MVQLGYAVKDPLVAAAGWHRRVGAGPFFVRGRFAIAKASFEGAPAVFEHSAAFGQWGPVMVELIVMHRVEPEPLARALAAVAEALHHVTWFAENLDVESARLEAEGFPKLLDVTTVAGVRFLFHDAREHLGHLIEIYEPGERVRAHYAAIAAAALEWDGRDPVRTE